MKELEIFKLEQRVLFEAAAVAEIVDAADAASQTQESSDEVADNQEQENLDVAPVENNGAAVEVPAVDPEKLSDVDAELDALIEGVIPGNAAEPVDDGIVSASFADNGQTLSTDRELVVVNDTLKDKESIFAGLQANQDVLILSENNGLTELNEYLNDKEAVYSAIHFVTHGTNGEICINGEVIDSQTFDAAEWSELGGHLTADGDILFYACDLAEDAEGQKLMEQIAEASDADVAASTDVTGRSGDWDLEYQIGEVETSEISVDGYGYDLNEKTVSTFNDLETALKEAAKDGGDLTITVSSDITFDYLLSLDIEKDLTLTIKGATDGIGLSSVGFRFDDAGTNNISISIENLDFDGNNNTAKPAIYADGIDSLSIKNLDFDGNKTAETAIYADCIDNLSIKDSLIENFTNSAVIVLGMGSEELNVENTVFSNNVASTNSGGAINTSDVSVTINKSYFSGNKAVNSSGTSGGALNIMDAKEVVITNTSFDLNTATSEGGAIIIANTSVTGSILTIDNCTFYENSATDGNGGAIAIYATDIQEHTITNSTFVGNVAGSADLGSAVYNAEGALTISNSLLIGEGSVVAQDVSGETTLSYSLATSSAGSVTLGNGAEVSNEFTKANVFGSNIYDTKKTHTIAPDAFHKAAYSGTLIGTVDQLGNSRNAIYTATGLTKYTIGAVNAAVGFIVTQGDYETYYTGEKITPVAKLSLAYADGTAVSNSFTAALKSDPAPILAPGEYTITPENAVVTDVDAVFKYNPGKLTVKTWETITIQETTFDRTYGDDLNLSNQYTIVVQDKITGNDVTLTISVEWDVDGTVITGTDYSATNHINADSYADSLTVKSFTVEDQNGNDMKSHFSWNTSTKSDLNVGKKSVTVTLNDLADKTYNGVTNDAAFNGGTVSGAVSGETLDVTAIGSGIYNSKNVAEASTATFTVALVAGTNADLNNYILSPNQAIAAAKITKLELNLSVVIPTDKVYDGTTSVDSSVTVNNIVAGDDVTVNADWNYNSSNVKDANLITNTTWEISGSDAGNYTLPSVTPYTNLTATITAKIVDPVIESNAPYYYNETNQSGTVSAYYVDINGNKIPLTINWGGREFKNVGDYTITLVNSDTNYALSKDTAVMTMNVTEFSPHRVYCEGLYPGHFSVIVGMQSDLAIMSSGNPVSGNIYTMQYPELVNKTMLGYGWLDNYPSAISPDGDLPESIVTVDPLIYRPFTIDAPVREISGSLIDGSILTNDSALYSGEELFSESGDDDFVQLFGHRGEPLSVDHEPIVIDSASTAAADYHTLPVIVQVPEKVFQVETALEEQALELNLIDERQSRKVSNFKSVMERLLDKFCLA